MNPKRPKKRINLGMVLIIEFIIIFSMGLAGAPESVMIVVSLVILAAYEVYKYHDWNHKEDKK